MSNYLITGAAGFIGARTSEILLEQGHTVTGIDNMNDAYDPRMKEYRLARLRAKDGFTFFRADISHKDVISLFDGQKFDGVINLAARAGVRLSVENPWAFVDSNVTGTLNMLEGENRDAFPSGHTEVVIIVLIYAWTYRRWYFWMALPLVTGLIISTVYLRYHYVVDVLAGMVLAPLCVFLASYLYRRLASAVGAGQGQQ